jgi:hypothetical protein
LEGRRAAALVPAPATLVIDQHSSDISQITHSFIEDAGRCHRGPTTIAVQLTQMSNKS